MTKKRKSLDDSLAKDFVFGGDQPRTETEAVPTPEVEAVTTTEEESTSIAPMPKKPVDKPSKELSPHSAALQTKYKRNTNSSE